MHTHSHTHTHTYTQTHNCGDIQLKSSVLSEVRLSNSGQANQSPWVVFLVLAIRWQGTSLWHKMLEPSGRVLSVKWPPWKKICMTLWPKTFARWQKNKTMVGIFCCPLGSAATTALRQLMAHLFSFPFVFLKPHDLLFIFFKIWFWTYAKSGFERMQRGKTKSNSSKNINNITFIPWHTNTLITPMHHALQTWKITGLF